MKIEVQREAFLSACQLASAATSSKDVKPILRNLKAIVRDGRTTLLATDLELGLRLDVQGLTVLEPGEAMLPAQRLTSILRESREERLVIESTGAGVDVRGGKTSFEMPSENPAEFPDIPGCEGEPSHRIKSGELKEATRRVAFAAADDNSRVSLCAVLFEVYGQSGLSLVATDGRRLATVQSGQIGPEKPQTALIPPKALALLSKLLDDDEEEIGIVLKPSEAYFQTSRATIYTRLVDGRYPDYRQVLKAISGVQTATFRAEGFLRATRQAGVMVEQDSQRVKYDFAPGVVVLQAQGATAGRSRIEADIDYQGKPVSIQFNPAYLVEMLKIVPGDAQVSLDLMDGTKPALFRVGEYRYLVMPLV